VVWLNSNKAMLTYVQILIGLILLYASIVKTQDIPMFALVIKSVLPNGLGFSTPVWLVVAEAIVFVEAFVGVSLIVQYRSEIIRYMAIIMFFVFSAVLLVLLTQKNPLSCGCFGYSPQGLSTRTEISLGLVRNVIMIVMLLIIMIRSHKCQKNLIMAD